MIRLVIIPLFLFAFASHAQENQLFFDDFQSNTNDWKEVNEQDHERVIQNGKLMFNTGARTYYWCAQTVETEKKQDFSIETELTFVKWKSGEAGLMWGSDDKDDKVYFFLLSSNGAWNYGVWSPSFFSYTGSQKSPAINKGNATNKLKVAKVGGKLKLYINDVEVHSAKFPSTRAELKGLVSGGGNHIVEADYFKVTALAKE
jgi:hypothetical protein